jgi:hypothetical protein
MVRASRTHISVATDRSTHSHATHVACAHGAHALDAQGKTNAEAARKRSPQSLDYWAAKVDPDGALPEQERCRRAEHARKAYMTGLALASSQARRKRGARPLDVAK